MTRDLTRIGDAARRDGKAKFTSIYHFVGEVEHLRACYERIEKGKAVGVDGVTKEEYGQDLDKKLGDLSGRLNRMGYQPQPVRRVVIPKEGNPKGRPLGIPCVEDKIVQMAVADVLEQIYEADFMDCSYGYRPGRGCHQAVDELGRTIQRQKVSYVVEADIKGFFTHVNHEWMMKFLGHRIQDQRLVRLISRLLKGGVMEDGLTRASNEGVPQGGNLSPLLSNVYLHYTLDLWFERLFRKTCRGEAYLIRYADDFVACFQYREDAERFLRDLPGRLAKFHLEVEPTKTKLIEFGRYAASNAAHRGKKPETFDFLGFTFRCDTTRQGSFKVKRWTAARKFRAKLKEFTTWVKRKRSVLPTGELLQLAKAKLVGHLNYYAITDNGRQCESYRHQMVRILYKWLNRQSQKRSYPWERLQSALNWVGWPSVRIHHKLCPFRRTVTP